MIDLFYVYISKDVLGFIRIYPFVSSSICLTVPHIVSLIDSPLASCLFFFLKPKNLSCRNLNEYFSPYSAKNSVASRPSFHSWASHAWQRRSWNLWVTLTQLPIWFINQRQSSVAYINLRHSTRMYANLHDLVLVCAKPSSIYVNLHQFLRIYAIYSQFTSNLHRSMPTFANLQQIRRLLIHANL